jgi:hypothetical protein
VFSNYKKYAVGIPTPAEAEWKNIATKFLNLWDFPNCIGALDVNFLFLSLVPPI